MNRELLLEIRMPAIADRLCLVRALVKRAAEMSGCNTELTEKLVIALNEACMNVIQHAYKEVGAGEMSLEILNNGSNLTFRLTDFAPPVNLEKVKPRDLDELRPGGLGVYFIREIMDECNMGHLDGGAGNFLEMTKKIN